MGAQERKLGMTVSELSGIELGQATLMNNYGAAQLTLVAGKGCYVWDEDGKRYLDFLSGIAVNALGHAHPALVKAVSEQVATLAHVSNFFVTPPQLDLAARLLDLSGAGGAGRVFFANSGAEANEAALKLALLHGRATGKTKMVALEGCFHGRTMGSLSLTSNKAHRDPFEPLFDYVSHVPPTVRALREAIDDDVAAVFLEPIQGEVGVIPLPDELLVEARELASKHGALLVIDEVQTGVGRLGDWFGYQQAGITPDIITLAKGLGGGLAIGACVAFEAAAGLFYPGSHGSTFGGNPLASEAALTVLDTIENDGLLENAALRGEQLKAGIETLGSPLVRGVRGRGLLLGVTLTEPVAKEIVAKALELGLIINAPRPDVVRVAPPLIIGDAQVEEFLSLFSEALSLTGTSTPE